MSERSHLCLRCGCDVFTPGACCRDCRSTAKAECDTLTRERRLAHARREAHRLRILHRGQTPWAAAGPPPSPAGYTNRPVELTSIEPGPARRPTYAPLGH